MNHDPASECINDCPRTEMKSISLEEYRRIVNDATELNRANEKIRKLELLIQQKDDEIKRLEKHLEKAKTISENLSPVSLSLVLLYHVIQSSQLELI